MALLFMGNPASRATVFFKALDFSVMPERSNGFGRKATAQAQTGPYRPFGIAEYQLPGLLAPLIVSQQKGEHHDPKGNQL
jgi:hypothetical protein